MAITIITTTTTIQRTTYLGSSNLAHTTRLRVFFTLSVYTQREGERKMERERRGGEKEGKREGERERERGEREKEGGDEKERERGRKRRRKREKGERERG